MTRVLYEELTPAAFRERIAEAPVAYLPLGTLEWHGEHLPLGADMIQPKGFFTVLAERVGGIVLPPLFVGPDRAADIDGHAYYGMDTAASPVRQLDGSAYWVDNALFDTLLHAILLQLKRSGFRVVVAHGHGPSTVRFIENTARWESELALKLFHCWHEGGGDGIQTDHAGGNETSLVMRFAPDLPRMDLLEHDEFSRSMFHSGPPSEATAERGAAIVEQQAARMEALIKEALQNMA